MGGEVRLLANTAIKIVEKYNGKIFTISSKNSMPISDTEGKKRAEKYDCLQTQPLKLWKN